MIEREGNLFDSEAKYLAHGVNCKGVMGAGIAKEFRSRYPSNYMAYKERCGKGILFPGDILVHEDTDKIIVNMASQNAPGKDARYLWLIDALYTFARKASAPPKLSYHGGLVAIPEIGCGIGGLKWPVVKELIAEVERAYPSIVFEVWHYKA